MSDAEKNPTVIPLKGRIDSNNAALVEADILSQLESGSVSPLVLDMQELDYISSAGLRVLLRLRKTHPELTLINVNSEVYEILDMTGFTEMLKVEKAYRVVSVEGCEVIGRGANGTIYRVDLDNVVKVYNNADALEDIQHEREVAKLALILGIPTAISYDVVKVGDSYGSMFELLSATPLAKIIANEPEKLDWCVKEYVEMLKKIHETVVPAGKLPDIKETVLNWARFMRDYLPKEAGDKLVSLVEAVPQDDHMIHGDYHTGNLMRQGDETLLIDMDTLAVGHPVFELASIYNALAGFSECNHEIIKQFQGYDYETAQAFWRKFLMAYLETTCAHKLREVEDKARIVGYTRLIRRSIRRGGLDSEASLREIDHWKGELLELLDRTDTLLFSRNELEVEAISENLTEVQTFLEERLGEAGCPPKTLMQINVAVEEIFINIASYAYAPETGNAVVRVEVTKDPAAVTITFSDRGKPYDPTAREDPDISLSADDRPIGGLGVFLTKKIMDEASYEFKDGQNVLTLKKTF